jgi:hypothetical protein
MLNPCLDRIDRAAAKVEHARAIGEMGDEPIVPDLVVPGGVLAIAVPRGRVLLVVFDDAVGEIRLAVKSVARMSA